LRDLRKARKFTQARVAKTLGISQDSVSRLGKTQRSIAFDATKNSRGDTVTRAARAFGKHVVIRMADVKVKRA